MRGTPMGSLAAAVACVALLAALPAPCPCPGPSPAAPAEHGCCAPPAGWSAAPAFGCCPPAGLGSEIRVAVPEGGALAAAAGLVSPAWTAASSFVPSAALPEAPPASPPPTVRRL